MQKLHTFYSHKIQTYKEALVKIKSQLFISSMLRLVLFVAAVFGVYMLHESMNATIGVIVLSLAVFLFLVSRHTDINYKKEKLLALIKINETELQVLDRNFHKLPDGGEFKNPLHHFSQDIDLFGKGSFYQYLNRTVLHQGSKKLADIFTENTIDDILEKQNAVKELAELPEWRQEFSAIASLVKTETPYDNFIARDNGVFRHSAIHFCIVSPIYCWIGYYWLLCKKH